MATRWRVAYAEREPSRPRVPPEITIPSAAPRPPSRFGMTALLKGFGCRPFADARGPTGAGVRKPRKGGNRGEEEAARLGASYGDLKVADGSRVRLWGPEAAILIDGNVGDERVRSRAYEGLA